MRRLAPFTVLLLLVGVACGEGTPEGRAAAGETGHMPFQLTEEQREGKVLFETMCWTCHGESGRGDGPSVVDGSSGRPPTFHTLDFARASTESLLRSFRSGVGGSEPDHPHMQHVVTLLEAESFAYALSFIPALVYPPEIPGSALTGKAVFDARCAGCHGSSGTGDGPDAATFTTVTPADFTTDELIAGRNWSGVFRKISDGSGTAHSGAMPAWGVVLTDEQIWDLVAFVATFQDGVVRPPYWLD